MSRFIRNLIAKALVASACVLPLALPTEAQAQPRSAAPLSSATPVAAAAPVARPMTSRELHQHLARGAGWIRIFQDNGVRHGTGWILDLDKKLMITNNHVVAGYDEVWVTFPMWKDGKLVTAESAYADAPRLKATVIDRDANRDLALIRVESIPEGMHAFKLAASEPDEGDEIRLIGGFTNGGDGLVWGAVSGTVRACGPQGLDPDQRRRVVPVREVLSNAASNGGNSGAPVVNSAGELVAVHYAYKPWAHNVARHISVIELKAYLKEALPLVEPKTADEFLTRAKRRLNADRFDGAAADASAALAKNPNLVDAIAIRGHVFVAKKDTPAAIAEFTKALKISPDNYDLLLARGRASRTVGKNADAITDFSMATQIDPKAWIAYNERGLTHFFAKEYAEAEVDFGQAIDRFAKNAVLWGNRADARMRQNKFELAVEDWAKANELAPSDAYYSNGKGLALLRVKKFNAAADAFTLAANASGNAPLCLGNLGEALRLAGKHDDAIKALTKAIDGWKKLEANGVKVSPLSLANDFASRGQSRLALKQYKDAADDLTKALDLTDRKVPFYFAARAEAFDGLGESAAAEADRKAAVALGFKFDSPQQPKTENSFAGTWTGAYTANGVRVTEVITFNANGTFSATIILRGQQGVQKVLDTGTWSVTKNRLVLNCKKLGTVVRQIEANRDEVKVEVDELGITVLFTRSK